MRSAPQLSPSREADRLRSDAAARFRSEVSVPDLRHRQGWPAGDVPSLDAAYASDGRSSRSRQAPCRPALVTARPPSVAWLGEACRDFFLRMALHRRFRSERSEHSADASAMRLFASHYRTSQSLATSLRKEAAPAAWGRRGRLGDWRAQKTRAQVFDRRQPPDLKSPFSGVIQIRIPRPDATHLADPPPWL